MSVSINAICRKDRINQNRTTNIYLRFTVNRRSRYVSTGINIPADDWDFDTQTLKTQNPAVQLRIYEQIEKYDKRIKRLEALEVPVTLDNVLETDGRRVYCTIAEYFRRTIAQLESVGKIGSTSKHKVTFSLLQQFRSTNIRFDEITVGYLRDFELFLMKKGNKSNSIATKFSVLKAVYNKALAEGIFTTPHSPFLQFKIGRLWTATRKRAIRKEDVQRLMQAEIPADGSAYLDFARDIFLFSYLSAGINFKDIATLRYCDMDEERIYYARHKTSKEMTCHLSEQSKAIIGKYAKSDHADEGEEKHYNILLRRLRNGQCFRQPVLGNREFSVRKIELVDSFDYSQVSDELMGDEDLGIMLYKMNFRDGGKPLNGNWDKPVFSDAADAVYYHPHIVNGVIDVKKYREEGLKC